MRAALLREGRIVAGEFAAPVPGPDEVLVRTLACGICGSDLHARTRRPAAPGADEPVDNMAKDMDPTRDLVMGHEFCAEVLEHGPGTARRIAAGKAVCSMPMLLRPDGVRTLGYSNEFPGGFGELMVLSEALLLPVGNGLSPEHAALTEPFAVGAHAVAKAQLQPADVPLVLGCGPIGLAVVAQLKRRGASPILAADYSARRRELARTLGADVVIDPASDSPYRSWEEHAALARRGAGPRAGFGVGRRLRPCVIFECVGVPGMIGAVMRAAQANTRIVVVGVCMQPDQFHPLDGINKELSLHFALGYSPLEFAETLQDLEEGRIDPSGLVTGRVTYDGVARAFEELANPETHCKILVVPPA